MKQNTKFGLNTIFLSKNSQKLSEQYPGKYIALVEGKIAGVSKSGFEAYKKAKEKFPDKEVSIIYLPTEKETVTLL